MYFHNSCNTSSDRSAFLRCVYSQLAPVIILCSCCIPLVFPPDSSRSFYSLSNFFSSSRSCSSFARSSFSRVELIGVQSKCWTLHPCGNSLASLQPYCFRHSSQSFFKYWSRLLPEHLLLLHLQCYLSLPRGGLPRPLMTTHEDKKDRVVRME